MTDLAKFHVLLKLANVCQKPQTVKKKLEPEPRSPHLQESHSICNLESHRTSTLNTKLVRSDSAQAAALGVVSLCGHFVNESSFAERLVGLISLMRETFSFSFAEMDIRLLPVCVGVSRVQESGHFSFVSRYDQKGPNGASQRYHNGQFELPHRGHKHVGVSMGVGVGMGGHGFGCVQGGCGHGCEFGYGFGLGMGLRWVWV